MAAVESSDVNDRRALEELMRAHGDAVLGYCARILGDRQLAEEVKQQTFYEACRDFDRVRERSSRISWLFGIARHRCLDAIRRQTHRSTLIDSNQEAVSTACDPGSGPNEQLEQAQITMSLEDCLKLLTPEVRTTVLLRFQRGLPYEELAILLSASAAALQMRVARALPLLRRCLETKGFFDV